MSDDLEKLKAELEIEKAKVKALQDQINPPPRSPYDYVPVDRTAGMSMDRETMLEMMRAVPESVMRGIREDARKPNPVTEASSSRVATTPAALPQVQRGSGWVPERGFPDRTKEFELVDRIVKKMVGGPNDPVK